MSLESVPRPRDESVARREPVPDTNMLRMRNELQIARARESYFRAHPEAPRSTDRNTIMLEWVSSGQATTFAEEVSSCADIGEMKRLLEAAQGSEGETVH